LCITVYNYSAVAGIYMATCLFARNMDNFKGYLNIWENVRI